MGQEKQIIENLYQDKMDEINKTVGKDGRPDMNEPGSPDITCSEPPLLPTSEADTVTTAPVDRHHH